MKGGLFLAALLGVGAGSGVLLMVSGLRRREAPAGPPAWRVVMSRLLSRWPPQRLALMAVAAVVAFVATGWPVAGVLAGAAAGGLPAMLRPDQAAHRRTSRLEALAVWTEMLRDTLGAAAGLEQALRATAQTAPEVLRDDVNGLLERLDRGERLPDALRALADDFDDPVADLVVAALLLAAERQARQLGELLGSLATATREQVTMRLKADADRARVRTSVRVIVAATFAMGVALLLLDRAYLAPYGTVAGQLMLSVVGALFVGAFLWMSRIARLVAPPRLLHLERRTERRIPS